MRDFFERQRIARRNTWFLLAYFFTAAVAVAALVAAVIYVLFSFEPTRLYRAATPFNFSPSQWDLRHFAQIGSVVLLFILAASFYKYWRLASGGGSLLAERLGGKLIFPDTTDFRERRLLNIVEEMALASGVTVPFVYLLEKENGINALAAGLGQEDAVIAVTWGALKHLTREELQGVIGHEFSHILHGDMALNIRLLGLLHGILAIGLLGEALIRMSGSSDHDHQGWGGTSKADGRLIVFGGILFVLGYIGVFSAKLIKAAVSRQREYLADAAAVQFTRNPLGLAGALRKIGGLSLLGAHLRHPFALEISHMAFGNAQPAGWLDALNTHPPLAKRIKRLDPLFDGTYPKMKAVQAGEALHEVFPFPPEEALAGAVSGQAASRRVTTPPSKQMKLTGKNAAHQDPVFKSLAHPTMDYMRVARQLIAELPGQVLAAARTPFGARAVVYGVLLDPVEKIRRMQQDSLERHADPQVLLKLRQLLPELLALPPYARLPLIDLCLPALRLLSGPQHAAFRNNIDRLIKADRKINLFEYCLYQVLKRHLDLHFGAASAKTIPPKAATNLNGEIACVLSLLARQGQSADQAEQSFRKAAAMLGGRAKHLRYLPPPRSSLKHFDAALNRLASASFAIKGRLLSACVECVTHDSTISIQEAETLRAIADTLGCPIPPWLRSGVTAPPAGPASTTAL